jgi:hypothetical protein
VTEAEWMERRDPQPLLRFLRDNGRTARKRRLFACACCRHVWRRLSPAGCVAVEVAERYADGQASDPEREAARKALGRAGLDAADKAAREVTAHSKGFREEYAAAEAAAAGRHAFLAALVRDIFGNPFRPAPTVVASWLAWNGGTVAKLAAAIYDERRFGDLPILAGALEDAGCADAAILAHCREPGEHVKECWVVDLLLGKS